MEVYLAQTSEYGSCERAKEMQQKINEKLGAWFLAGNSKSTLAEQLGITSQTLNNKINGSTKWYFSEVVTIAKLTGCTLDELAD